MDTCPCGSDRLASECCLPIICRERSAASAEELMRSRYTAFVMTDIDWIIDSHHSDTVSEVERSEIERWSKGSEWLGLRIKSTVDGGPDDIQGEVSFRARYKAQGQLVNHVERARFEREDGEWKFHSVMEDDVPQLIPVGVKSQIGRNDPCHCGSGKKFKKCHGKA